ncbi:uncharacterized protein BO66DRAFT_55416 [Aspergillus aculeatinus CBS 121060]|uniref:Uncharacterized protein n=1 Tax=Aspergillus aculeatinus CBS 121060 TaxID=1448322 RepID=A0ACD1HCP5_9EURO|nr:hypothetical protein BO66DRAFT_55416 [Aspergillus aculeatinus CBS 121060]RAH71252.1 hypothetical protein BO66DRAFT_55416 [Aspergillus aculeatinus CBS 121060]
MVCVHEHVRGATAAYQAVTGSASNTEAQKHRSTYKAARSSPRQVCPAPFRVDQLREYHGPCPCYASKGPTSRKKQNEPKKSGVGLVNKVTGHILPNHFQAPEANISEKWCERAHRVLNKLHGPHDSLSRDAMNADGINCPSEFCDVLHGLIYGFLCQAINEQNAIRQIQSMNRTYGSKGFS